LGANGKYIREWVAAWNRGEMDALLDDADPDHEWVVAREHPDATTHRGPQEVAGYLAEWRRLMPDLQVQVQELEEVGDRVLLVMRMTGTGAGSGATTEVQVATINTFRDGKPVRTEEFLDANDARRALAAG
jgi:ketosteroid isomerase-like protein